MNFSKQRVLFSFGFLFALGVAWLPAAEASIVTFTDRTAFEATLGSQIVDDYENPGYVFLQSDSEMTAVLGETVYTTTGWENQNLVSADITGNHRYCAGCNGSFELDFMNTSESGANGVFGLGFDFGNFDAQNPYYAFVTFGNGSTQDIALPHSFATEFFGITADEQIATIHLGLTGNNTTRAGSFVMDNLTVGSSNAQPQVPEPTGLITWALLAGAIGLARRRIA